MAEGAHPQLRQAPEESVRRGLAAVLGDDHAANVQIHAAELVDQPQHILLVGDAQIPPHLVLLNVPGADGHHNLHIVPELLEHPDLAVRLEPGQHPGGVVVVEELAAELQVELAAELADPIADAGGLGLKIVLVVKSDPKHNVPPPYSTHNLAHG